ncbi:MAG: TrmH family RNA methyltransferase [Solirubrobacteraceae bacterium]
MTITSPHNQRLKELRKLQRARERARSGLFAAEGEDLIEAAAHAGRMPVEGFRASVPAFPPSVGHVRAPEIGEGFHEVDAAALAAVSTLGSGTRAIAVYEQSWSAPAGPLCVYLHAVGDPGNVGTVLRSAHAFGASSVALGPGCADPHSPKAVRASMGAIFAVRLARVAGASELPGVRIALVAGAGEPLWRVLDSVLDRHAHPGDSPPTRSRRWPAVEVSLLVGSEREGLPKEVVAACAHVAQIPIAAESLNAAMAATVALYEMARPSIRVHA